MSIFPPTHYHHSFAGAELVEGGYFLQGSKLGKYLAWFVAWFVAWLTFVFLAGKAFSLYKKVIREDELTEDDNVYMKLRQDQFFDYVRELVTKGSTFDEFREGQALLSKVMLCAFKCEVEFDTASSGVNLGVVSSAESLKEIRANYRIATNLCKLGTGTHTAELRMHTADLRCLCICHTPCSCC